jgi:hypothetical protein
MPSGAISPMPPDCSARLRSLLYDYQPVALKGVLVHLSCVLGGLQNITRGYPSLVYGGFCHMVQENADDLIKSNQVRQLLFPKYLYARIDL